MLIETEKDLHIVQMYTVPNLYNNHCIRRKSMLIETEKDWHIVQMYTVPNLYNNHCTRRKSVKTENDCGGLVIL